MSVLARIVRTFEAETPRGSTRQFLARTLELVTVPRRGDRVALSDRSADAVPVDHALLVASNPGEFSPGVVKNTRATVWLEPEPADRLDAAFKAGWKAFGQ